MAAALRLLPPVSQPGSSRSSSDAAAPRARARGVLPALLLLPLLLLLVTLVREGRLAECVQQAERGQQAAIVVNTAEQPAHLRAALAEEERERERMRLRVEQEQEQEQERRAALGTVASSALFHGDPNPISAYSLTFPSLAHWNAGEERAEMSLLVSMSLSRSLVGLNSTCDAHRWCANNRTTCSICSTAGCASGQVELHTAPQEGFSIQSGWRLDDGQVAWLAAYAEAHGKAHDKPEFHFSTVSFRCRAPAGSSMRVSVDGAFSVEQLIQALPTPSQVSRVRGKPVVCGRVLAGKLAGDMIARSVRLQVQQGMAAVVMYELGVSRIERRELLDELLRSGSLVIVDLRDVFQDLYGNYAQLAAVTSHAFSQWLARYDCMRRVRPLRPSWIAFLDADELPLAGIDVPASTSLTETLQAVPADKLAARFQTVLPKNETEFCQLPELTAQQYAELWKERIKLDATRIGNAKYMIRPELGQEDLYIHWIQGTMHDFTTGELYLLHARCMHPYRQFNVGLERTIAATKSHTTAPGE
jgi:hypothetical protein